MGSTWVLSAPDGPHVGPMNLAIRVSTHRSSIIVGVSAVCPSLLHQSDRLSDWRRMTLEMAWRTRPLQLVLCGSPVTPTPTIEYKQRFLTPGHQGWNDLHSLCRIGMEYYLLNNDDNNIIYWIMMITMIMMMIIIMIIMMTMMIIGTATIMIMIIIITTTLTMTIMKMIMIKTAQTPCQSL